jgi:hypothetical protein
MDLEELRFPVGGLCLDEPARLFHVWSEGFAATGQSSPAIYHGTGSGRNFREACDNLAEKRPEFKKYYDPEHMTYWGCRLFDNETDARRSFG